MGAGAARTEAARAMVAMREVYILEARVEEDQVHGRTERRMKFETKGGVVTATLMNRVILYRTGPVVSTYVFAGSHHTTCTCFEQLAGLRQPCVIR
jgi:hypothetical protein